MNLSISSVSKPLKFPHQPGVIDTSGALPAGCEHGTRAGGKPLFLLVDSAAMAAKWRSSSIERLMGGQALHVIGPEVGHGGWRTTHALARRLVAELRAHQPQGPYHICGWGDVARLAYAAAVLLIGLDEELDFFALMHVRTPPTALLDDIPQADSLHIDLLHEQQASSSQDDPANAWARALSPGQLRLHPVRTFATGLSASHLGDASDAQVDVSPWAATLASTWANKLRPRPVSESRSHPAAQHNSHLAIQRGRAGHETLFCLPGAGNSVTSFTGLAEALGSEWPVHGLQPRGVDGLMVPHASVEVAAACCERAIAQVQPNGPLHLLGHSFGGWVAYELACRLSRQGREVRSLTLVDTEVPDPQAELIREYTCEEVLSQFIHQLELSVEQPLHLSASELAWLDTRERLEALHGAMVRAGLMPRRSTPAILRGPVDTFASAVRTHYRPKQAFEGETNLVYVPCHDMVQSHNAAQGQYDRMLAGWRVWVPKMRHRQGPGNHITVLKYPHIGELAQWWLEKARQVGAASVA